MKRKITVSISRELLEAIERKGYSYSTVIGMALEAWLPKHMGREKNTAENQKKIPIEESKYTEEWLYGWYNASDLQIVLDDERGLMTRDEVKRVEARIEELENQL